MYLKLRHYRLVCRLDRLSSKGAFEGVAQGDVCVGHAYRQSEIDEAGDAVLRDAARYDAIEVTEVGFDVQADTVQADPALWKELSTFARKTLGVEMEAHAVGTTAELHQIELALVMKGVMDRVDLEIRAAGRKLRGIASCQFGDGLRALRRVRRCCLACVLRDSRYSNECGRG